MALKLKDGYTLPFVTEGELRSSSGEAMGGPLTPVRGKYRPPLFGTKNDFEFALLRAASGPEETKLVAEFIVSRVAEWDIVFEGSDGKEVPAPITADFIREHLPNEYALAILKEVRNWKGEAAAAGN